MSVRFEITTDAASPIQFIASFMLINLQPEVSHAVPEA